MPAADTTEPTALRASNGELERLLEATGPEGYGRYLSPAMKELRKMAAGPEEAIDLARANLLVASEVPEFSGLDIDKVQAEAESQVRVTKARAEAQAISLLAKAHAKVDAVARDLAQILDAGNGLHGRPACGRSRFALRYHKSGHGLNNKLLRTLQADTSAWQEVTFERADQAPIAYVQTLSIPATALAS
jgi:hypothetical protein